MISHRSLSGSEDRGPIYAINMSYKELYIVYFFTYLIKLSLIISYSRHGGLKRGEANMGIPERFFFSPLMMCYSSLLQLYSSWMDGDMVIPMNVFVREMSLLLRTVTFLLSFDRFLTIETTFFVRPVDDGLRYASIYPFADEWKRTFSPMIPEDRNMELPLPVHFWFRCVDGIARIYFTFEDTHAKPINNQPQGTEIRRNLLHIMQSTIKLKLDSVETRYTVWNGGADVQLDVRSKPYRSVLRVQINDWTPYTAFPMDQCVRSCSSGQHQDRQLPINAAASSAFWNNRSSSSSDITRRYSDTVQMVLGLTGVDPLLTQQQQSPTQSQYQTNAISKKNKNRNLKYNVASFSSSSSSSASTSSSTDIVVHVHTFDQFMKGRHPKMQVI